MSQPIYQVDAFTDQPFCGNPAGVCLLPAPREEAWMRAVAREMNLSETAFLLRRPDGDGFDLRWFTPAIEVDLCGHATLASAHVLWQLGEAPATGELRFHTKSGLLTARRDAGWIELDFPALPAESCEAPEGLAGALGLQPAYVGRSRFDLLVLAPSEEAVRSAQPDIGALAQLQVRGICLTAAATDPRFDFVSRFFAPAAGIDEDPVTGSAHCTLGPFWAERLGKADLLAYQASARGGTLRVGVRGERVLLAGQAVTVLRAELLE